MHMRLLTQVCLKGNGEDCHRTWEAVLLGSIPIVRPSGIGNLYKDAPILILGNGPQKGR